VRLAGAGQGSDDRAETTAVNELDVAQVQDDGAAVAQQPGNMGTQRIALAAGNNPSVASHNGDVSDPACVERKAQWASDMAGDQTCEIAELYPESARTGRKKFRSGDFC
jgi:type IV secretory pathway TrbL component